MAPRLKRVRQIDRRQWTYLLRAVGYLSRARVRHRFTPADRLLNAPRGDGVGRIHASDPHPFDPYLAAWAVEAAARHLPWRADCLIKAMAAAEWLARHGIETGLHLGVARAEGGALNGHAWLTLGDRVIIGADSGSTNVFVPILTPADGEASAITRPAGS